MTRNDSGFRADSPHSVTAYVAVDLAALVAIVVVIVGICNLMGAMP
jgi:hypothetical protein